MKTSIKGTDWIVINEENYKTQEEIRKFHLIKLEFIKPTVEKVNTVIEKFTLTNRYIIQNNIRFYNDMLKARKKYYIENLPGSNFVSFIKKNNKILLNIENLSYVQKRLFEEEHEDVLRNVEVLSMNDSTFEEWEDKLRYWSGNVLLRG